MEYNTWVNQTKPEKRKRGYQHLDDPLDLNQKVALAQVIKVIEDIKKHQFLPFIKREDVKIRFRKNKSGVIRRERKLRPIMYASHIDAHIYSYYNFIVSKKYDDFLVNLGMDTSVIAYRRIKTDNGKGGKSNIHFAKEVFEHIKGQKDCVVVTQDIEGFFDNLHHKLLKDKLIKVLEIEKLDDAFYKVFRSLTAFRYIEHSEFILKGIKRKLKGNKYAIYQTLKGLVHENKSNKGIPQGSPISGLLANIYMVDFDHEICKKFPNVFYRRYSDDLVFICSKAQLEEILNLIKDFLSKLFLSVNPRKSFITYFEKNGLNYECKMVTDGLGNALTRNYVDYLGFEFNGNGVFLRKNTIQRLKKKQMQRATAQLLNSKSQKRRFPKKIGAQNIKSRNNYFKRSLEIFPDGGIRKQILKAVRDRNRIGEKVEDSTIKKD